MNNMSGPILLILAFAVILGIGVIGHFVPLGLWFSAMASSVRVSIAQLIGMRFRRVDPKRIVNPLINATKAGLHLDLDELQSLFLAGGNVDNVVRALISADKAG